MTNTFKGKRKVILVTDGDRIARKTVEIAAKNVGARCISCSAGNPTVLSGEDIVKLIKTAPSDPVIVMLDDHGVNGAGRGEQAMEYIVKHPDIQVLGAIAVASNTDKVCGCTVDLSVTSSGEVIKGSVDKYGNPQKTPLEGDTVEILDTLEIPIVVGIGDIGKMNGSDRAEKGAPLTTKAIRIILDGSGYHVHN